MGRVQRFCGRQYLGLITNKHDSGGGGQKYQSMCDVIYVRPLCANFASTEKKITSRYFRRLKVFDRLFSNTFFKTEISMHRAFCICFFSCNFQLTQMDLCSLKISLSYKQIINFYCFLKALYKVTY